MGTTIGLVGELSAVRTDAWAPIPQDISIDDLWIALDFSARGYRIAYEPDAKAFEPPEHRLSRQWERRTRIAASALYAFSRRRDQLRPSGGLIAAEIWGHRLTRYTVVPIAHVALLAMSLRRLRTSRLARLFLLGHVIGGLTVAANTLGGAAGHGAPGGELDEWSSPARVASTTGRVEHWGASAARAPRRSGRRAFSTPWPSAAWSATCAATVGRGGPVTAVDPGTNGDGRTSSPLRVLVVSDTRRVWGAERVLMALAGPLPSAASS